MRLLGRHGRQQGLNRAPNMEGLCWPANSPSLPSVVWPMPRLGVVMARRKAGSSSLLLHSRSQAHRSLISARSKKLVPPEPCTGCWRCAARFQRAWPGGWRGQGWQSPSTPAVGCVAAQALDARPRRVGLVLLGVAVDDAHRLTLAQLAEQGLGKQLGVGADHVVGRAQDGAGGAVVLLQLDDLQLREVLRQAFSGCPAWRRASRKCSGHRRPRR